MVVKSIEIDDSIKMPLIHEIAALLSQCHPNHEPHRSLFIEMSINDDLLSHMTLSKKMRHNISPKASADSLLSTDESRPPSQENKHSLPESVESELTQTDVECLIRVIDNEIAFTE